MGKDSKREKKVYLLGMRAWWYLKLTQRGRYGREIREDSGNKLACFTGDDGFTALKVIFVRNNVYFWVRWLASNKIVSHREDI